MIDLLIADDHELIIDGLRTALKDAPDINIKGTAKNGYEVIEELKQTDYDVVLLDVNMPEMDGIKCAKKIHNLGIDTKILILSQFGDKKLVDRLVNCNINGYILKSTPKEELIEAIRAVYNNKYYFSKEIKPTYYIKKNKESRYDYIKCKFSKREMEVLKLICDGKINSEIAENINVKINTVETYRHRIMQKSGLRNAPELVKWVIENDIID